MLYLVTTEAREIGLIHPQQSAEIMERQVIPGLEAVVEMEKEKKVLAGGVPVGERRGVFIIEAASNEELGELLLSLPQRGIVKIDVTPLESYESRLRLVRKSLEQLKAILQ